MKRVIITVVVALLIMALALFCAFRLLSNDKPNADTENPDGATPSLSVNETETPSVAPTEMVTAQIPDSQNEPVKDYNNGLASFRYDSTKIYFDEIPSDNENGFPVTSFLSMDTEGAMPRVDVYPLSLAEPFTDKTTEDEWKALVTTLIKSYYSSDVQNNISMDFSDVSIDVKDTGAEMSLTFKCVVKDYEDSNMAGSVRLAANTENAIIITALYQGGDGLPEAFANVYTSGALN